MAVTTDELLDLHAYWREWVTGEYELSIEVREQDRSGPSTVLIDGQQLSARIRASSLYCQVQIRSGEELVFDERTAHDAKALRASVVALTQTVAAYQAPLTE